VTLVEIVSRWIIHQKVPISISFGFGFLASLIYVLAGYAPGGGRLGAWYVLYYLGWPISSAANQVIARLEGRVPNWLFGFCYVAGVIVAGMVSFFLVTSIIKFLLSKLKAEQN
jgi:hypothetical protein